MKKIIIPIIICVLIIIIGLAFKFEKTNNDDLTKVTVAEVAHSIFYIPQYIADAKGYFEEEGLDVEIILTPGADKVTAAVLSGDVNIGLCGSEATIYVYNQGESDYLINFAGLTKRDGSFIVSREKIDGFTLNDLKGKYVIGGREGGMPEMTFEYTLSENGINPKSDLTIDTSIAFSSMAGAFIGGTGDYVLLFEPQALQVENQGIGYVVASLGELGGVVPYTAYNAKKSYIEANPEIIKGFTNAIQKGIDFTFSSTDDEIANLLQPYFPDTSINNLIKIVNRYRQNDSWFKTTYIEEDSFNHIQDIMETAGELDKRVSYQNLVINTYSKR